MTDSSTPGVAQQLEGVLQRLLYRDTFGLPKLYESKEDIRNHINKFDKYFKACNINNASAKATILLNSLSDDIQMELCGLLEFKKNEDNYEWLSKKLMEMFLPKETELSPYVKLFSHKQEPNQTTREYLAQIRREGYRLLKDLQPEEREKRMIEAFCNGLLNKELKKAMKLKKVETLDEAFNLIKKEKLQKKEDRVVRMVAAQDMQQQQLSDFERLQNQISLMQKQLTFIVSILQAGALHAGNATENDARRFSQRRPSYAEMAAKKMDNQKFEERNLRPQGRPVSQITCFCCGKTGHIARMCTIKCLRCGRRGHMANRCFLRANENRRNNVRFLCDSNSNDWNAYETLSSLSVTPNENFEDQTEQMPETVDLNTIFVENDESQQGQSEPESKEVHMLRNHSGKKLQKEIQKTSKLRRVSYLDDVNQWADYIDGKTKRKPKTRISSDHSEKAENKPIVRGFCQGHACKILCDSGAEVNVIDDSLVREIQQTNQSLKVVATKKSIKCANNSALDVVGSIALDISFFSCSKLCNFIVVRNLFPKVILGIRAMKDMKMSIDPSNNQVLVSGMRIPFLSKDLAETVVNQGNERQSVLRVGGRRK